jgi:hypothetical protein
MSIKLLNGVSHTDAVFTPTPFRDCNEHYVFQISPRCECFWNLEWRRKRYRLDEVLKLNNIKLYDVAEQKEFFLFDDDKNNMMQYELNVFVKMILEDDLQLSDYLLKMSCETVRVLQLVNEEK